MVEYKPACGFREALALDEGGMDPWELDDLLIFIGWCDHCVWHLRAK